MQLGEPVVKRGPRLKGRHDGYGGDRRRPSCREEFIIKSVIKFNTTSEKERRGRLTAGRRRLVLQEAPSTERGAEDLREGRRQLTGSGDQLQSPEGWKKKP